MRKASWQPAIVRMPTILNFFTALSVKMTDRNWCEQERYGEKLIEWTDQNDRLLNFFMKSLLIQLIQLKLHNFFRFARHIRNLPAFGLHNGRRNNSHFLRFETDSRWTSAKGGIRMTTIQSWHTVEMLKFLSELLQWNHNLVLIRGDTNQAE